ncbi:MAG: HAD hydrolase family protein [Clostridia bacterium]|nr:HAD hydrolase family protein [Clostridia bacterium]
MKKLLAFDVDGTLADVYSNIQPGVQSVFLDKRITDCGVTFITGNTLTTIKKMRENLQKLTTTPLPIHTYCASLGGAIIYNEKNEVVFKSRLCKRKLVRYLDMCVQFDPKCFFMLMLEDKQIFCHVLDKQTEDYIRSYFGKMNMDPNEIYFADEDYHTYLRKISTVFTVNIFNSYNPTGLYKQLLPIVAEGGYFTYTEKRIGMVQISSNTKLKALKYILRKLKQDGIYNNGAKKCVFFGDGGNDITSMEYCGMAVARGENLDEDITKISDVYANEMTPYLDKIFE